MLVVPLKEDLYGQNTLNRILKLLKKKRSDYYST